MQEHRAGIVKFNITASSDIEAMKDWPAEQIKQFFEGVAMVISAANAVESRDEPTLESDGTGI